MSISVMIACEAYFAHFCVFPQWSVLLHGVCEILWATDEELLCQSIFTCCVSSYVTFLCWTAFLSFSVPPVIDTLVLKIPFRPS